MIRYSELMIGDYCLVEGKIMRVESLTKRKIGLHINEDKKRLYYARLCEVFPIEINEYILRTSGFCLDETEKRTRAIFNNDKMRIEIYLFKDGDKSVEVIITNKETNSCYVGGGLRYVHEIQHIFKPCGLNFEIKL